MKKFGKALAVLASVTFLFGFASCSDDGGDNEPGSITIGTTGYEADKFYVGDEATLTATAKNVSGTIQWSTDNEDAIEFNTTVGAEVTVTALAKGTAIVTAAIGNTKGTYTIVVGEDLASKTIDSLPWSVEFPLMGTAGALNYSTSGNGHANWGSMSGTATYAGLGFDGEFIYTNSADTEHSYDTSEYYVDKAGVFFNYYAGGETGIGECVKENGSADVRGYITVYGTSILSDTAKSVKITINASYIPEKTNVSQIAIATPEWYVLGSEALTETATDYVFYVDPGKTFYVFNNGPKDSFMGVYTISAEESEHDPIEQTKSVTSVTVTGPAQVSKDGTAQMSATVKVKYNAEKTVTWSISEGSDYASVDASTGAVTGKAAGTAKVRATSTFDDTVYGEADIEVIEGEVKPQVGTTYVYNFKVGNTAMTEGAFDCSDLVVTGEAAASADGFVSWNTGWKKHSYGLQTNSGSELYIKVAGSVLVGWTGYKPSGNIDITYVDSEDNEKPLLTNVSASGPNSKDYIWFIYKGEETTVNITFGTKISYIQEISVKPWTDEVPTVESVSITEDAKTTVEVGAEVATYKATVSTTYFANSLVTWSVTDSDGNDTTLATIGSETGVLTTTAAGKSKTALTASSNVWTFTMTSTEELISGTDVNTIIAAAKTAGQTTCSDVATANNYIPFYINGVTSASGQGYISSIVLTYGDKE